MSTTSASGEARALGASRLDEHGKLTEAALSRFKAPDVNTQIIRTEKSFTVSARRNAVDQVCMCVAEAASVFGHNGCLAAR